LRGPKDSGLNKWFGHGRTLSCLMEGTAPSCCAAGDSSVRKEGAILS
jgi:hypothetical protein